MVSQLLGRRCKMPQSHKYFHTNEKGVYVIHIKKISSTATPQFDQQCYEAISEVCGRNTKSVVEKLSAQYPQMFVDFASEVTYQIARNTHTWATQLRTSYVHCVSTHVSDSFLSLTINHYPTVAQNQLTTVQMHFHLWYKSTYDVNKLTLNQVTF